MKRPFDPLDATTLAAVPGAIATRLCALAAASEAIASRWRNLDRDWQAVCLGSLVTFLVGLGLRIPW